MNLFTNTIDTLLIAYFLTKWLDKKFISKKGAIIFLSGLIIFNTLVNSIFGLVNILGFISIFIVSTIIYSYLLDAEFMKTLISSIVGVVIMFINEIIVINIATLAFKIDPSIILSVNIYKIISIIIAKGSFYLMIKYGIGKLKIAKLPININRGTFIIIGTFNIVIIFMTFTLYKYMDLKMTYGYMYLIGMGFGSLLFSWLVYKIIQKLIYQSQREIIWKMREEEFHKKDFYMKSMNDILQTIRSQKHDLNNYLSTLYGLIYLERFEESKKYITEVNDRITNMDNIVETSHPIITALVSLKKSKAFEDNIDIKLDIDLPENLQIDFVDLSIIIGNLIDNAIEASQQVKEGQRKIELSMYVKEDYLVIKMKNTKLESQRLETDKITGRFTTKTKHEDHGFGLGNVEYVVKQYNGIIKIEDLANEFIVDIALFMDEDVNYDINLATYAT